MIIQSSMNPKTPLTENDSDCISFFYRQAIKAATVSSLQEAQHSADWASDIQNQIMKLVKGLSVQQHIHRELNNDGECDLEFVESHYADLICFLSELGVSVAEMSDRLKNAKDDIQKAEYIASNQAVSSAQR